MRQRASQPGAVRGLWQLLKAAIAGRAYDYTSGSTRRAVFLLAVPMVLEMFMESLFAVVDTFFVARLGADAVAVVGLTEAVLVLLYAVVMGMGMAVTAVVARRIGAADRRGAAAAAGQAIWIGLGIAAVTGALGVTYATDVLRLMGASPAVIATGSSYTAILLGGSVSVVYLFLLNAIFRGAGDASIAMRSLWLANGCNIVLDPGLIFGLGPFPELGVTGAAVATTIGRSVGVIYQLYFLLNGAARIRLAWQTLAIDGPLMSKVLRIAVGGILQYLIATSSWLFLIRIISAYGSGAVAGYTIALRVLEFTILPAWGFSNAVATLVGQNLGAGRPDRAEQSVWQVARYNTAFLVTVGLVFISFAEPILRIFSADPTVVAYGADCLRWVGYGYAFFAIGMVVTQAFNGAGDTRTPSLINFACYWVLQLPLAYGLAESAGLGPRGVFIAIMVAESALAVVGLLVFRRGTWKRQVV